MPRAFRREYGKETTLDFVLWEADGVNINATASSVLGDTIIVKDGGVATTATSLFSAHATGSFHTVVLTSAEMEAARIVVTIIDHHSTKEWLDEVLFIETYGHPSSQETLKGKSLVTAQAEIALTHDWSEIGASAAARSSLNAQRLLRNRWAITGSALTVYKENDTSAAWTSDLDTVDSGSVNAVVESDPD